MTAKPALLFSGHAVRRMVQRAVTAPHVRAVLDVLDANDIIESHPDDTPYPSALYIGVVAGRPLHVLAAHDVVAQRVIVVTVYEPDPSAWDATRCYTPKEVDRMNCVICKTGEVKPGTTTFTAEKDGHTYVVRDVPAGVCQQCGEPYFDADVTTHILAQIERASESGVEVAVLTYQAA